MERVHAQAHDLEGTRALLGSHDARVKVVLAVGKLALARREVLGALLGHRKLQTRVRELVGGLALRPHGLVVLGAQIAETSAQLLCPGAGGSSGGLVLLDVGAGIGGARGGGLALTGHLALLVHRTLTLGVKAPHLGGDGGQLAREARHVALRGSRAVTRGGERRLSRAHGLGRGIERRAQLPHALLEGADAPLALEGSCLGRGRGANHAASVRGHGHAVLRDVGERRCALVGANGLVGAGHKPDVAEKRREERARGVGDAQVRDEGLTGRVVCRHRSRGSLAKDHGRPSLGATLREGGGRKRAGICRARHDKGGKIVTEQALYQGLRCLVSVDEVRQTALDQIGRLALGDGLHERACLLHVGVDGAQRREGGLRGRELRAGRALLVAGMFERRLGLGDSAGKPLRLGAGVRELRLEARLALSPLGKRLLGRGEVLGNLLEAALVHAIFDLGIRDLVLELGKGERLLVRLGTRLALVRLALVEGVLQLAAMRHGIARRLRERVHALLELALAHAGVREVSGHAFVLLGHVSALLAHGRELHAHLGEARDHVFALLLQKAHVRVHTAKNVLHAATLLAKVAHKEALLLEE